MPESELNGLIKKKDLELLTFPAAVNAPNPT